MSIHFFPIQCGVMETTQDFDLKAVSQTPPTCMNLGKLLIFDGPDFLHLQNISDEDNKGGLVGVL